MTKMLLALICVNILVSGVTVLLLAKAISLIERAKVILFLVYDWLERLEESKREGEQDE